MAPPPARVVVLNGVPRAGKSSIVAAMQALEPGWWNLGVDTVMRMTPPHLLPGIGLRPGGERPDLEDHIVRTHAWMWSTVADRARRGTEVVVDVGLHDSYSRPLGLHSRMTQALAGVPAWLVGVRCPIDAVMARRAAATGPTRYLARADDGSIPEPVLRFEAAVHDPGRYDLEVDTGANRARECATAVLDGIATHPPVVLR